MQWAIMQRLDNLCEEGARCDVFANSKVESIERDAATEVGAQGAEGDELDLAEWPVVRLGDGRVLRTRLLVHTCDLTICFCLA